MASCRVTQWIYILGARLGSARLPCWSTAGAWAWPLDQSYPLALVVSVWSLMLVALRRPSRIQIDYCSLLSSLLAPPHPTATLQSMSSIHLIILPSTRTIPISIHSSPSIRPKPGKPTPKKITLTTPNTSDPNYKPKP